MDIKNLFNYKYVHFIGIGGISMSALALMLIKNKVYVSGSDLSENEETKKIRNAGGAVFIGHKVENISPITDLVVFTGAVKPDNVEYSYALNQGIKMMERSQFLGEIAGNYSHIISVSGTHGKTTTTALIGHIFNVAGLNPTVHIGGESLDYGNLLLGGNEYFITEACEYRDSFKYLSSEVAVITNIDAEHLDYYINLKNEINAFENFAKNSNYVFTNSRVKIQINQPKAVICDKFKNSDYWVKDIVKNKNSTRFSVMCGQNFISRFTLNMIGEHNVKNALYAIAVALHYKIDVEVVKVALVTFKGIKRRYEMIGEIDGKVVICDYAHHPNEIRNSIKGLVFKYKKILTVFQPHTYSRTEKLLLDFKDAFVKSDNVIIYKTYSAREVYNPNGDENILYHFISNEKKFIANDFSKLKQLTLENVKKCDLVLVLGAGDIYEIFKDITKKYGKLY